MRAQWPTAPLGEVARLDREVVSPERIAEGTKYVGLEHIESSGKFLAVRPVLAGELASAKFAFTGRHILYGKLRPYLSKIACPDFSGICSTDILPVLPGPRMHKRFLLHYLRQRRIVQYANSRVSGANLPRLSPSVLEGFEIPVPPLAEQNRIAEILDRAEVLVTKRRQALDLLRTFRQASFVELFGEPIQNPKGWPERRLIDLGTLDRGVSRHRPRNDPQLLGGRYPLIQTGEVANSDGYIRRFTSTYSEAGLRQSKMWPAGTLCITIAANIAKTGILTFDACFPDSVVAFQADQEATVLYVQTWLSFLQKMLEETAPEVAQKNINLAILRELTVPAPPLELQERFAKRVKATEVLKSAYRESMELLEELFSSLQQRAFSGAL